jgi:FemAB family protein
LDAELPVRNILTALSECGLTARLRSQASLLWRDVAGRLNYLPVDYSLAMIDYQLAYWSGSGCPAVDISLVLMHDNRPCGIWPLSATSNPDGQLRIGSNGGPVMPPLFIYGLARKSIKSVTAGCLAFLERIGALFSQTDVQMVEAYVGGDGMSEWHDRLMQFGAQPELRHDMFLDLSPAMPEIKSAFRKSYKALITSGGSLWKVGLASSGNLSLWEEFRLLHMAVAGRATRSLESWRLQHEAITSGDAFFVYLRDVQGRMVGGGLFHVTVHEGLYAIGAYDRSLFGKPLGHVVQYHAIEEMKRRGVRWYKLGVRCYSSEKPEPSEKEVSISNFKQGFSSHLFPRYLLHHNLKKAEA